MIITSDVTVKLRKVCGSDLGICESAWVSSGNQEIDATEKRQRGLIRALVRDKHGCYDKDTEVLTKRGWVPWPTATIEDEYATLNLKTNVVEYQKPLRIINKPVNESLIRIKKRHVDLLVTKDHNLLVSQLSGRDWKPYELVPACDVVQSTFRIKKNGAEHTLGWTQADREKEITYEPYEGIVYCVTVPNGTLYVRRNGKPCWCGNSPTEEGFFSFYINAPRAVRDEHVRHRIGSYSSSSLRYKMSEPQFYIPPPHRPLKKAAGFKQIQPIYVPYSDEEYQRYREILIESYQNTAQTLDRLFQEGYTETEARRWVTTDSLMTPYIARFNPRSLINFLSLRTHDEAANHVSFPMWEIEQVARQMESCLKEYFPLLYEAWNEFGREAL